MSSAGFLNTMMTCLHIRLFVHADLPGGVMIEQGVKTITAFVGIVVTGSIDLLRASWTEEVKDIRAFG